MKRNLFISLVLAVILLCACNKTITTQSDIKPTKTASAIFTVTSFKFYKIIDYLHIYYEVENNGNMYIRSYEIHFDIKCDDGSNVQFIDKGWDVFVGEKWPVHVITEVDAKDVLSIEITKTEVIGGTPPEIIYEVNGTAETVSITLNNDTGGTEQYSIVYVPVRISYSSFNDDFLYISAQNNGEYGTVKVTIYVNGKLYKTSSSSGAYVIADAYGSK